MALIKCEYCGHTVSTRASKCPNCGAPIKVTQPTIPAPPPPELLHPTPAPGSTPAPPEPQPPTPAPAVEQVEYVYTAEDSGSSGSRWLKILFWLLGIACVGGFGYYLYNSRQETLRAESERQKEQQRQADFVTAARLEAARKDSLRRDSIAKIVHFKAGVLTPADVLSSDPYRPVKSAEQLREILLAKGYSLIDTDRQHLSGYDDMTEEYYDFYVTEWKYRLQSEAPSQGAQPCVDVTFNDNSWNITIEFPDPESAKKFRDNMARATRRLYTGWDAYNDDDKDNIYVWGPNIAFRREGSTITIYCFGE